jgi:hypothetical protein
MRTKYYGVTEQDIEEIKARWWCYDDGKEEETNPNKNNVIST